jgi:hypothetical protein
VRAAAVHARDCEIRQGFKQTGLKTSWSCHGSRAAPIDARKGQGHLQRRPMES